MIMNNWLAKPFAALFSCVTSGVPPPRAPWLKASVPLEAVIPCLWLLLLLLLVTHKQSCTQAFSPNQSACFHWQHCYLFVYQFHFISNNHSSPRPSPQDNLGISQSHTPVIIFCFKLFELMSVAVSKQWLCHSTTLWKADFLMCQLNEHEKMVIYPRQ